MNILFKLWFLGAFFLSIERSYGSDHEIKSIRGMENPSLGFCKTKKGRFIDLSKLLFIRNKVIPNGIFNKKYSSISIREEKLVYLNSDNTEEIVDLNFYVGSEDDFDISSTFALSEGQLYLYWRQTFIHRSYYQGLLKIDKAKVSQYCYGSGGVDYD